MICVISMEFLSQSRRLSSLRNVPSDKERRETHVFAGLRHNRFCMSRAWHGTKCKELRFITFLTSDLVLFQRARQTDRIERALGNFSSSAAKGHVKQLPRSSSSVEIKNGIQSGQTWSACVDPAEICRMQKWLF